MKPKIPLLFKWVYLLFVALMIPVYWDFYGPGNFLWLSDIVFFLCFLAVIFESSLLASMAAVGGMFFEILWLVDFIISVLFNVTTLKMSGYMFDPDIPVFIRAISLFHVGLPFLFYWLIVKLGYNRNAWKYQTFLSCFFIIAVWAFTPPEENINLVFSYLKIGMNAFLFLFIECAFFASVIYLTHRIFCKLKLP